MSSPQKTTLILGGLGMLGHQLYRCMKPTHKVSVTIRGSYSSVASFGIFEPDDVVESVDAFEFDSVVRAFAQTRPNVVINAVGLIKQLAISNDPLSAITINAQFPHRLAWLCAASGCRLIHVSTDCVFSGKKGNYLDTDISDAEDLYGRTKYLGEVPYEPHAITLRTSIIGPEIKNKAGLVEWFLSQKQSVAGYMNAIYTGFTTFELSRIIREHVIPNDALTGVYNVSSNQISKFELLQLLRETYRHNIEITQNTEFHCDRSLNSDRFRSLAHYSPPEWHSMIREMYEHSRGNNELN